MWRKVKRAAKIIRKKAGVVPEIGIVLGTGLVSLAEEIEKIVEIPYSSIPNFRSSTVEGHTGNLIIGKLAGKTVLAMQGRLHHYEGYKGEEIVFPIRVMKELGIQYLLLSNASGGLNPDFEIGDIMIQTDHVNFIPNPLIGKHDNRFGARFPDMSVPYDPELIQKAKKVAQANNIKIQEGVYLAVTGPTLETPAEYKAFRMLGADAVGMSTVPEVIAARQMLIPCFAVSIITDLGVSGKIEKVTHADVQREAQLVEPMVEDIFRGLLESI